MPELPGVFVGGVELRKLIKRSFDLWVQKLWLKEIDKAIDKHQKAIQKANRNHYIVKKLIDRYNEIYNENLWEKRDGN